MLGMIPFSVLDLSPIVEGGTAADAFRNSRDLAQHAERWGYNRYWVAEHHSIPGVASAATSVLIGYLAEGTHTIRVGAGGIMLPNHAPLQIAEQFGTLESLYPGRIDLGLGRAPGSDGLAARALRRGLGSDPNAFPRDVLELQAFFAEAGPNQPLKAVPGAGLDVPLWILGSSTFGAQLAAHLGLPYAFASHFAPGDMMAAINIYRQTFQPSEQLDRPYVMLGYNIFAADTEEEAQLLASSAQQSFVALRTGQPRQIPPPVPGYLESLGRPERAMIDNVLSCTAIGTPDMVRQRLQDFIRLTGADELMLTSMMYDHGARLRSYEIAAGVRDEIRAAA
jgi:luciferase family oxidoreductase group 1